MNGSFHFKNGERWFGMYTEDSCKGVIVDFNAIVCKIKHHRVPCATLGCCERCLNQGFIVHWIHFDTGEKCSGCKLRMTKDLLGRIHCFCRDAQRMNKVLR